MKKKISILLAAALILTSGFGVGQLKTVYGAESDSKGLERAIVAVKNIVEIPAEYNEFTYNQSEEKTEDDKGEIHWNLQWNNRGEKKNISAVLDNDSNLLYYNKYDGEKKEGFGSLTKAEGEKIAKDFLVKARSGIANDMREVSKGNEDANSASYIYKLYKEAVPVEFVTSSISVNKFTHEVESYSAQGIGAENFTYPDKKEIINLEKAEDTFLTDGGISLVYMSFYDYDKKSLKVFPAYVTSNNGSVVDAKTGKFVNLYRESSLMGDKGGAMDGGMMLDAKKENKLSPEELSAVKNVTGLISKDKAENLARTSTSSYFIKGKLREIGLSQDYTEKNKYFWNVNFDKGYVKINANTGEIITFYCYDSTEKKGAGITAETARNTAEAFALKNMGAEKWKQFKISRNANDNTLEPMPGLKQDSFVQESEDNFTVDYTRQVNGIDYISNTASISINKWSGEITSYSVAWNDNVSFPPIEKALSKDAAFVKFAEFGNYGLKYMLTEKNTVNLVYDFKNPVNYFIDPFKGEKIGYDGNIYKEKVMPIYTDINGSWCENTVKALLENGYYLEGKKFNPKQKMTQETFLRYIYSPIQGNYDGKEFYKMMESVGIIKKEEIKPTSELAKKDAAKFVIRYLDQEKAAMHSEVFKNVFNDTISKDYLGYAALCNAFGIIKGDEKGRFLENGIITNAEGAVIIYRTLMQK